MYKNDNQLIKTNYYIYHFSKLILLNIDYFTNYAIIILFQKMKIILQNV